jgi:hypothetical protein
MLLGKKGPKMSFQTRRFRLGVAHHGAPSAWTPPVKEVTEQSKKNKKKGRH